MQIKNTSETLEKEGEEDGDAITGKEGRLAAALPPSGFRATSVRLRLRPSAAASLRVPRYLCEHPPPPSRCRAESGDDRSGHPARSPSYDPRVVSFSWTHGHTWAADQCWPFRRIGLIRSYPYKWRPKRSPNIRAHEFGALSALGLIEPIPRPTHQQ